MRTSEQKPGVRARQTVPSTEKAKEVNAHDEDLGSQAGVGEDQRGCRRLRRGQLKLNT
ncbi:hypothetical protein [Dactylosporangium matsuzakiense]|uniref:hypothetical protein n=1 Tax=Dactylosporangium matsuzakiense TaxID=53360 RepID=UPI0021C4459E|nr:hypothetical protein [Dactylosporangium matsuzakiense]UWZ42319.1 hypothetical protein Dmats_32760 [Dactylosporangium matsuzakiense]